ncbi:RNA polymerase sigma factor [Cohnella sp. REN36]|uniref:RNA polymerase sigma factor n=1 Tax=Cohnella sp. REN36 TaxID=2887347 RepID=UPI001D146C2A|nr:RNA polymerase sigma factor [Cohnella sp. REN36]MCC3371625.1 RNA polymerase sigma factor [Cohnella sp. REN36]
MSKSLAADHLPIELSKAAPGPDDLEALQAVVRRYCLSLTGSSWDGEDLAQETWLKALGTRQLRHHPRPEALLLRIARHTWIDHARRKATLARILDGEGRGEIAHLDENGLALEHALHAMTARLSPLQRTVLLLREVFDYTILETADLLNMTEGAVKAALHRARRALESMREELAEDELPLPADEGLKALLRAMAAAFRSGDVAALVSLAQQDVVAPAVAIGIVRQRMQSREKPTAKRRGTPTATRGGTQPVMRLAA